MLQLTVLQPAVSGEPVEGASLKTLIQDPYILVAAGKNGPPMAQLETEIVMSLQVPFRLETWVLRCWNLRCRSG